MNTILIGSSREQKLPSLVLEFTIHQHAKAPVRVIHSYDLSFPVPRDPKNRSRTGFSFARFAIPKLTGYKGVAAYLECDQLVFKDVAELFSIPFDGATVLRPANQASVLLIDCEQARWDLDAIIRSLDEGKISYSDLMENLSCEPAAKVSRKIPLAWNTLEKYDPKSTALLHYTNMAIQPWRKWGHPLGHLWMGKLKEAMRAGRISLAVVEEEVRRQYVVRQVAEEARRWSIR